MKKRNKEKNKLYGIAAAPGIAISEAKVYSREQLQINYAPIEDVEEAKKNLDEALERSKYELRKILTVATEKMGEKRGAIFEAQIMMLDDPIIIKTIKKRIEKERLQPEAIVYDEITKYQNMMSASNELYMKERSQDIEDIKNRIIRNLQKKRLKSTIQNDVVIVSNNLTPADTILFAKSNVKGYITDHGGLTSHAAIIARSLNIPAVVGTHSSTKEISDRDTVIVDGFHGWVIINPTEKQLKQYQAKLAMLEKTRMELAGLKELPAVTTDGREIILRGNIDLREEIEFLELNGAKGIGLLRTEQLFADSEVLPDEEDQYLTYKEFAELVAPDYIIIRAFDIGGDKMLPHDIKEANPFLGWRGIRFLLDNQNIFKAQIRAVLRAAHGKNVKLMLPMICTMKEITDSLDIITQCKKELEQDNIPFSNDVKLGIMIEIPSAAIMAREYASEVDFISIGTNDLIQYLLAVDRGNDTISSLYQEFHPSVVRMLKHVVSQSKEANALVSMCGEMAADSMAIPLLVGLGLDSLSVAPSTIPYLKRIIRSISYESAKALAEECLLMNSEKEITERVQKFFIENLLSLEGELI